MALSLDHQVEDIREALIRMASLAERSVSQAVEALTTRNDALAAEVEASDTALDELEIRVDDIVITFMLRQRPVATDCRLMLVASKISAHLERIGDEATTIARRARHLNREPALLEIIDEIPGMAEISQQMLHDSIKAFADGEPGSLHEIIMRDLAVDEFQARLAKKCAEQMHRDSSAVTRCLHLITAIKSLERIGDRAQNIAEEVHYLYCAEDIRHQKNLHPESLEGKIGE